VSLCQPKEVKISLAKQKFCCVDNYSVLIPYRDLEKMLETANNLEQFQAQLKRTNEQLAALRLMYTEVLEKVAEMDKYL